MGKSRSTTLIYTSVVQTIKKQTSRLVRKPMETEYSRESSIKDLWNQHLSKIRMIFANIAYKDKGFIPFLFLFLYN